jgi:hypothetical protein
MPRSSRASLLGGADLHLPPPAGIAGEVEDAERCGSSITFTSADAAAGASRAKISGAIVGARQVSDLAPTPHTSPLNAR